MQNSLIIEKSSNTENQKGRCFYLDAVTGILIFLIMASHAFGLCCCTHYIKIFEIILYFYVPWFFYKGGLVYKSQPLRKVLKSSFKRLLVPFFILYILALVENSILLLYKGELSLVSVSSWFHESFWDAKIYGNGPLWFIPALFLSRILYCVAERNRMKYFAPIFAAIILVVFNVCNSHNIRLPMIMSNGGTGLMFFSLAHILKDLRFSTVTLFAATLFYLIGLEIYFNVDVRNNVMESIFWLCLLLNFAGCVVMDKIGSMVLTKPSFLSTFGANSMVYYCLHWPIYLIIVMVIRLMNLPSLLNPILVIVITLIIIQCMWMMFKKNLLSFLA